MFETTTDERINGSTVQQFSGSMDQRINGSTDERINGSLKTQSPKYFYAKVISFFPPLRFGGQNEVFAASLID
jgi:hypothetical protein